MFQLNDIGQVIAERQLRVEGRPDLGVKIRLGRPQPKPAPNNKEFSLCPYQIVGLGDESVRAAGGVDAFQALQLALEMIGADLHLRYGPKQGYELRWEAGQGNDLGFPMRSDLLP